MLFRNGVLKLWQVGKLPISIPLILAVGVLLSLLSLIREKSVPHRLTLLASDAALLHGYAIKQIAECFAGTPVEERVIGSM